MSTLPLPPQIAPVFSVADMNGAVAALLRYLQQLVQALENDHITSFATWTPGVVANGGWNTAVVQVNNAQPGQPATVGFTTPIPAGMWLDAFVTAPHTVRVTLFNLTGAPVTVGLGTLEVTVFTETP